MSTLVVEVCEIETVKNHPNADVLDICTFKDKGWECIVRRDQFKVGQKCVYFPPDSVLSLELANGPEDTPPGRLGVLKYLKHLPKDEEGNRPEGGRVAAARLRGYPSYGLVMSLDAAYGDDLDWPVGTDVTAHYGVTKYEPPEPAATGEADRDHPFFYRYTGIEHIGNYAKAFAEGEEVILTEKIHGQNSRIGYFIEEGEWVFSAGSHDQRRKEYATREHRYRIDDLHSEGIALVPSETESFVRNGLTWKILEWLEPKTIEGEEPPPPGPHKVHCQAFHENGEPVLVKSYFWDFITDNVKNLLLHMRSDEFVWPEFKHSIMLYGEIYGDVQDMRYGLENGKAWRAFDVAINNHYLDFDKKVELFSRFGIEMVPTLYRGPFSMEVVKEYTSGPTTMCDPKKAGKFKGREGVVISPVKEEFYNSILNGRKIAKSVSADYHARKGGTEFH